jgi:hypothetical protein
MGHAHNPRRSWTKDELCSVSFYMYLGNHRYTVTPSYGMVEDVVWKVGVGNKIFINNSLTSPKLFTDLHNRKLKACGTVSHKKVLKLYDWK